MQSKIDQSKSITTLLTFDCNYQSLMTTITYDSTLIAEVKVI